MESLAYIPFMPPMGQRVWHQSRFSYCREVTIAPPEWWREGGREGGRVFFTLAGREEGREGGREGGTYL